MLQGIWATSQGVYIADSKKGPPVAGRRTGLLRFINTTAQPVSFYSGVGTVTVAKVIGGLSWSADARRIVFTTTATNSKLSGIAVAEVETGSFRVLTDGNDFNASFSARGDRLVFTSMRDGNAELYPLNLNAGGVERLTNNMGLDDGAVFVGEPARPARQAR